MGKESGVPTPSNSGKRNHRQPYDINEDLSRSKSRANRLLNANYLRFRGVPEEDGERTEILALKLVRSKLDIILNASDFASCKRVDSFDLSPPRDILIQFRNINLRDQIYKKGLFLEGGISVCDNLCSETTAIWRDARKKLGNGNVKVVLGVVHIRGPDNKMYPMYTHYQFSKFLENYILK